MGVGLGARRSFVPVSPHRDPDGDELVVFGSGENGSTRAGLFAAELAGVLQEWGIRDECIGVDRLDGYGFLALQAAGVHLVPVELAIAQARS